MSASIHQFPGADQRSALGPYRPRLAAMDELAQRGVENPTLVIAVEFISWRTWYIHKQPKVRGEFRIVELGHPDMGVAIARWWRARELPGKKPKRKGQFRVGPGSELCREFVLCCGMPSRIDRIPLSRLGGQYLKARVKRVTRNGLQRTIPPALQYDTITELLGVADAS